ncbi:MAG: DedA family protein [Bacilli bacterium]|nr:DedA family protein [Bacilli bacterium]
MDTYVLGLISDFGYLGMFLGMVLEAVIIIIPSELILATGGILAGQGIFSFTGAFLTGLFGSVFCAVIIYFMGYFGGKGFTKKYGKYFFMKDDEVEKSNSWFDKYGLIAACIGRNVPIVRTLVSLPIGVARLPFKKFLLYTTLGSIPWTFVFTYFGYALGNNWVILKQITSRLKLPIRILIFVLLTSWIYKMFRKSVFIKKKKSTV